jgi:hypothetical protein
MELAMDVTANLPPSPVSNVFVLRRIKKPTVTGASTPTTLPSSMSSSLAL